MGRGILALVLAMLAAVPAKAEWRRAVSPHFIVYSEGSEAELRAFAQKLERFDGLLRMMTPGEAVEESPVPLTVFMLDRRDQVSDLIGVRAAAGFYRPGAYASIAVVPRRMPESDLDPETILFHEYAHHFMLRYYSTVYPAWFVEGYAELYSTTEFRPDGAIRVGQPARHRRIELQMTPLPLRALMFESWFQQRGDRVWTYYAQAWYLTHFLTFAEGREGQLRRYILLLGQGRPPREAATEAFGDLSRLAADFDTYKGQRMLPYIEISFARAPAAPEVRIEALGPAEESLVLHRLRYIRGMPEGEAAGYAREVRERAARADGDPAALLLLAEAEFLAGNHDAAAAAADRLLALQPLSPRGLLIRGRVEIDRLVKARVTDAERWREARRWIVRANRADGNDPFILFQFYNSFQLQNVAPPESASAGLFRAFQLVPQDYGIRWLLANWLVTQRRHSEAVTVLSPVAYSPHETSLREEALRLLERIRPLEDGAEPPPAPAAAAAPQAS